MCCFFLVVGLAFSFVVPRPSSRASVLSTVVVAPLAFVEAGVAVVSPYVSEFLLRPRVVLAIRGVVL